MFLLIGSDPVRYRAAMLPAMVEKASFAIAIPILYAAGRVAPVWLGFAAMVPAMPDDFNRSKPLLELEPCSRPGPHPLGRRPLVEFTPRDL